MKYIGNNSSFIIYATDCGQTQNSAHFQSSNLDILSMETLQPLSNKLADYHHKKMWNVIHHLDQVQILSTPSCNARPRYSCL
jgi:hypothetical protein